MKDKPNECKHGFLGGFTCGQCLDEEREKDKYPKRHKPLAEKRKNKPHTEERKKKISESRKGQRHSLEARRNMSEAHKGTTHKTKGSFKKGYTPWNKKGIKIKRKFIRENGEVLLNSHAVWKEYNQQLIPKGFVIHHIDENPENDDIKNLRLMRKEDSSIAVVLSDLRKYGWLEIGIDNEDARKNIYQLVNSNNNFKHIIKKMAKGSKK